MRWPCFHHGQISAREDIPDKLAIDQALGLRVARGTDWQKPEQWRQYRLEMTAEGSICLSHKPTDENYQGRFEQVWTFSPEHGYALIQYQGLWKGKVDEELICRDFRQVGAVKLPYQMEQQHFYNEAGKKPRQTISTTLRIKSWQLDAIPDGETPFRILWPDGAVVLDSKTERQIVVRSGLRVITDEELQALSANDLP